ncbi:acyltransferase ChoActase/COT/CPT [Laetiporus sulphureus 93-53]|uniref:Acyltransferase ChoActase/COT/CPT n=1 Tax=Laetiporus sulphureus 93-53 TaxID=1314785 RepID=A0A165BDA8_9APHY|nr:acyltransferase ChoActase/COT/CPT [Laetiporus sulphureus 93-53]KZT00792.1 acyltransferase ChoActase/COT/CPT [Laetiporus sulphureus 93-53]
MLRRTQLPRLFMQASFSSRRAQAASASSSVSRLRDLPRLPVPGLHQTLQKYLKSLEPFLLEDEARGGPSFREAYEKRAEWVEDFERGIGAVCQERLLALDRASPTNWLDDNFWMKKAYHEWRAPLLVNSNWWLAFHNDPNVPEDVIHGRIPTRNIGYTDWQVRRASWLVHRILEWKARLERQDCHSDNTRAGIWLRDTAGKMFNIARLPRPGSDTLSSFPTPGDHDARKLIVHAYDWLYAIEVLDENMQSLPPALIERRLKAIVADVERRLARGERAVPVSVLTTDERDRWTEDQDHLLSLSPINHSILRTINHSLFALSLDHYTYVLPSASSDAKLLLPEPCTTPDITAHLHNVRSGPSTRPGHNRWYDKPFTLIVESNTRAGALGEHSPCDALVPSIAAEYAVVEAIDRDAFVQSERLDGLSTGWERLDWVVDERIQRECTEAERRAKRIVDDSDDGILWFDAYGAEWIRDAARLSPDAYIQMALQLAWYRTRGCFTATYETALTRLFKNGRTETIRTLTTDSRAFVLTMTDPHSLARTRHGLLLRAVKTHTNLTRHAATGRGIDRHLLGLQMMLRSSDEEHHILFDDELFTRSQTWKLSTSGLSAGHQFRGTGFGASYPDGYGINYLADSAVIKFGIESKFSSSQTSTELFKSAITQALEDLRSLCTNVLTAHL